MPQNTTHKKKRAPLKAIQERVIDRILAGETIAGAAEAEGVDRTTIHRWWRKNFNYRAAYNRRRRELHAASEAEMYGMIEDALLVVRQAVTSGDVRVALALLKGMGVFPKTTINPANDDAKHLRSMAKLEKTKQQLEEVGQDWRETLG